MQKDVTRRPVVPAVYSPRAAVAQPKAKQPVVPPPYRPAAQAAAAQARFPAVAQAPWARPAPRVADMVSRRPPAVPQAVRRPSPPMPFRPVIQRKTAIIKLTRADSDQIGVMDDDKMIRMMEADLVVDSNTKSLQLTNRDATVHELNPPDQKVSRDIIKGVTKLFIVGHGSGPRIAGLEPQVLARNLYAGIFESIRDETPKEQGHDQVYENLKKELVLQEVHLVACHGAEGGTSTTNFAQELFNFTSRLPQDWKRPYKVTGANGIAIVDYEGRVRVIPSAKYDVYKQKKSEITGGSKLEKQRKHMELLEEIAPVGTGVTRYQYDPSSLNF